MKLLKTSITVILFLVLVSFTAFHHGWANYNLKKVIDHSGTVLESSYENPHSIVTLNYKNKVWTVYLAPPGRMTDRGMSQDMIAKGKTVRVVAYPHKKIKTEMRAERIFVDGTKYELR